MGKGAARGREARPNLPKSEYRGLSWRPVTGPDHFRRESLVLTRWKGEPVLKGASLAVTSVHTHRRAHTTLLSPNGHKCGAFLFTPLPIYLLVINCPDYSRL